MKFTPKTEKELKEAMLLPEGIYDFDVLSALDTVSKSGNEMIEIVLGIYVDGEIKNRITDYLVPSMEFKLRHFCDTVGCLAEYEEGELTADICSNRSGQVKLGIEKDKNGTYPDKNKVKDYISKATEKEPF